MTVEIKPLSTIIKTLDNMKGTD